VNTTLLALIPDFVARTAEPKCCICDGRIRLYHVDGVSWAIPSHVLYSRIAGDSANGYEYTHQHCMETEDK
jgi:hypothetical protein